MTAPAEDLSRRRRCPVCRSLSRIDPTRNAFECPKHGRYSARLHWLFNDPGLSSGRRGPYRTLDALIEIRAEQALAEIRAMASAARRYLATGHRAPGPWDAVMVLIDDMSTQLREPGMYRVSLSAGEMGAHTVTVSPRRDR